MSSGIPKIHMEYMHFHVSFNGIIMDEIIA
jgi:hypothetical protein